MDNQKNDKLSRKDFLKLAGTATLAATASGLLGLKQAEAKQDAGQQEKTPGVDLSKIPEDI